MVLHINEFMTMNDTIVMLLFAIAGGLFFTWTDLKWDKTTLTQESQS